MWHISARNTRVNDMDQVQRTGVCVSDCACGWALKIRLNIMEEKERVSLDYGHVCGLM